ncbi:MAG: divalent metal cation transporter [Candidatus Saccharibacteria bacterium]
MAAKFSLNRIKKFMSKLGPGLVTGAADDDPSGIGTYSQAGAGFGFSLSWLMLIMLPMMIVIQEISGRIGIVTGKGLASIARDHYNRWVLYFVVFFLVFANTVNIGADIGAMAASAQLLIPLPYVWWTLFFVIAIVLLEVIIPYKVYAKVLKWLCISLLAYIITAFLAHIPWTEVLKSLLVPKIEFKPEYVLIVVALLGTTISPYLFFWEPSQEVEEEIAHHLKKVDGRPVVSENWFKRFRTDNFSGMLFSQVVAFFIMITAAATLHQNGVTNISTASQAAEALVPLVHGFPHAGKIAEVLFAFGIIGTGLLSIPVLAGSAAYGVSEALEINEGLSKKVKRARGFYGVIAGATFMGLLINFVGIDPIKALVYAAVINGVLAVPLIYMIIRVGSDKKIMGDRVTGLTSNLIAIFTLVAMAAASTAMVFIH